MEFTELPHGAWVVSRWYIRSPIFRVERQRAAGLTRDRAALGGIQETGGEVLDVRLGGGEVLALAATGSVAGVALDASGTGPVPDATIHLEGTSYRSRSGPDGRFRLSEVPEGRYSLVLERPELGSFLGRAEPVEVEVRPGEEAAIEVRAASSEAVTARACIREEEGREEWLPALVTGTVLAGAREQPIRGVSVEVQQVRTRVDGLWELAGLGMEWDGEARITDALGRFVLCADPERGWRHAEAEDRWRLVVRGQDGAPLHSQWIEPSEGEILLHTIRLP